MSTSIPLQIAETIQTASINRAPDPAHDINPSSAFSTIEPVTISHHEPSDHVPPPDHVSTGPDLYHEAGLDEEDEDPAGDEDIPYDVIRPLPRNRKLSMPPLPDLRFEQSYMASIAHADTSGKVMYITVRDQVLLPLVQGMVWTLATLGWRYWNRGAQLSGSSIGARVRRWWWSVNNWAVEKEAVVKLAVVKQASEAEDFYKTNLNAGVD